MKKYRKNIMNMVGTTMMGSAGSAALGSIGGSVGAAGQAGLNNAFKFMPAMGTMYGTKMMLGQVAKFKKRKY